MLIFALSRLLRAFITIALVVSFAFVALRLSGDPALEILSSDATPDAIAAFRSAWGLDDSIGVQFLRYAQAVFAGELGHSMRDGRDVLTVVAERIPVTLAITLPALMINIVIGIPAGVVAALNRNTPLDRILMAGAVAGFTVPSYVLGFGLVLIFSVWLGWLPSGGSQSWINAVLPVFTLGVGGAAILARYTRSAVLEVLTQSYVRTASAKGVPWRHVVERHVLPNAAIPTVTIIGLMVGHLVAGAVIVESIFSWPGIGRLLVGSVVSRDLAVVQGILLLVALTMVIANMAVDLLYGMLDPRTLSRRHK
ncbi:ABC transporter permease [Chelatococcus asaccharovorans]|uniref:Peptide/nickel transport system permease protein n=1 Tax=Chelatococcus asaccharovorans TaxID=28210 RepID=A0A2V3U467_9HYPH|nr:ABC transporter permease [Chelatococcus asaccharovorans]PXW57347.1 peptide/nickel transport system permease protein [Chelatococcus asaccharovorans]CAH1673677.1 Glutathione transport system permease protein GsiC [Chelatococcus asaccharovorans]CAH1674916.1 Glutathione transport system permease protein GsiC [Chelatococcus asaccharovorans]